MTQKSTPTPDQIKQGLIRLKEVIDASRPLADPQIVGRAQQALRSQVARLSHFTKFTLEWDQAKAKEISGHFQYVYTPTTKDPSDQSGITVFFDPQGNHVHTVETLFTRPSETVYQLQVWDNGKAVANESFDVGATQPHFSFDVLNSCLSNAGIAWGTIALIGLMCTVACFEPAAPVACPACIAAEAGTTGGTIGFCIGKALAS